MRRALKVTGATIALVAPLAAGWAYTAGATVGMTDSGPLGLFSNETVDEFAVDGYLITRESRDGVVTMTVADQDGTAIDQGELPADIADRVSYYESDWQPSMDSAFGFEDGGTCYVVPELEPSSDYQVVEDDNDNVRVVEAETDADGNMTVAAAEYDNSDLSEDDREALRQGNASFADIGGGTEIDPCDS